MTTVQPISNVLIQMDKAFQDEIITESGIKFFIDPSYNKSYQVTVTGKIAGLPTQYHPKHQNIIDSLNIGDEVCFSYRIAAELTFEGDGARFMEATEKNDYVKEFINGKGEKVRVYALPTRRGISKLTWVGMYLSRRDEYIDGCQGTEDEVERWLSQFPFGKTDIYTFDNFFEYNKQEYWKCELTDIFAKKVKGHLVAVGDRIICSPVETDLPPGLIQNIQHTSSVKLRYQDRGRIISGGKRIGLKKDTIISFSPNICEKYNFYGKEYFLIKENFVLGKWSKN